MTSIAYQPAMVVHAPRKRSPFRRFLSGAWPFILPGMVLYFLFNLYPMFYLFYVAMTNMEVTTIYQAKFVGLDNFIFVLKDPLTRQALAFTLEFVALAVPVGLALGFGLALLLNRPMRGRVFFRISIITPMAISGIIVGLMWRLLLHESTAGWVNAALTALNLPNIPWFSQPLAAQSAVFLVNLWASLGSTMIFMLGGLQTIPVEVLEAATVDGASAWQKLIFIKIPLLKWFFGLSLIGSFVATMAIFEKILMLTGGGPARSTYTIGFHMYTTAFTLTRGLLGRGSAIGVFMFLINMIFVVLYLRIILLREE